MAIRSRSASGQGACGDGTLAWQATPPDVCAVTLSRLVPHRVFLNSRSCRCVNTFERPLEDKADKDEYGAPPLACSSRVC